MDAINSCYHRRNPNKSNNKKTGGSAHTHTVRIGQSNCRSLPTEIPQPRNVMSNERIKKKINWLRIHRSGTES